MSGFRLLVRDAGGDREVVVDRSPFTIGRRDDNDLQLPGGDVSREHATLVTEGERLVLTDRNSRHGTFVNDEPVTTCELGPGDRIRFGRTGGAEVIVVGPGSDDGGLLRTATTARDDLRQVAALLDRVRGLGSGRVVQDVLVLVLDAALEISGAERAVIMLAEEDGTLEVKLTRARGRQTLTDGTFATSRKVPEEVFRTGQTRVVVDLLDADTADVHSGTVALGIRHIVCVPLHQVHYLESADTRGAEKRIGVLYLDSRVRGTLATDSTRHALEALAAEASVAIESARLYRDRLEKMMLESEMRVAAEIQRALLPKPRARLAFVEAAAATVPCRAIGGDFFDYLDEPGTSFGFVLGDVAGKGPPAALLSALMLGMFATSAYGLDAPAASVTHINKALFRRGLESRFVTIVMGSVSEDGTLTYCNGGHNPPFVIGAGGVRRLETGGPVIGLLGMAAFEQERLQLAPGDVILSFSDGVSEAMTGDGEEFGEGRLLEVACAGAHLPAEAQVQAIVDAVRRFTTGAAQSDDITVMVMRYLGREGRA